MKWYWIVMIVFILAIISVYTIVQNIISKIDIDFRFAKIDFKGVRIQDILVSGQVDVDIEAEVFINNRSSVDITVRYLNVEAYYRNQLIAVSKASVALIEIPSNSEISFRVPLIVMLDNNTLNLIVQHAKGQIYTVDYKVGFKVFKLPVLVKDSYIEDYA